MSIAPACHAVRRLFHRAILQPPISPSPRQRAADHPSGRHPHSRRLWSAGRVPQACCSPPSAVAQYPNPDPLVASRANLMPFEPCRCTVLPRHPAAAVADSRPRTSTFSSAPTAIVPPVHRAHAVRPDHRAAIARAPFALPPTALFSISPPLSLPACTIAVPLFYLIPSLLSPILPAVVPLPFVYYRLAPPTFDASFRSTPRAAFVFTPCTLASHQPLPPHSPSCTPLSPSPTYPAARLFPTPPPPPIFLLPLSIPSPLPTLLPILPV